MRHDDQHEDGMGFAGLAPERKPMRLKSSDEPFGRQPEPVMVTLAGDGRDTAYWYGILASRAEFKGDNVQRLNSVQFKIFPRAVND